MNWNVTHRVAATMSACAMLAATSGCGVMFGGTKQVIRAVSSPEGAAVTTAPATLDVKTPASLSLERKNEYVLTFSMPGYTSQQVQLKRSIRGGIVALDIVTCCLSVIIDAVTGGWYRLSPDQTTVTLTRVSAAAGPDSITVTINSATEKTMPMLRVGSSAPGVRMQVLPSPVR